MSFYARKAWMFFFVCLLIIFVLTNKVSAQHQVLRDTLEIRFHLDSIRIHMDFEGNESRWNIFERNFNLHYADKNPSDIILDIYAGASPEGTAQHNFWLGQHRGESIKRLIEQRMPGRIGRIIVNNEAARWDGLYNAVAASNEYWRDEVLGIIREPASTDRRGIDNRELKLRKIHDGRVWTKLLKYYLPPLRSGGSAIVSWDPIRAGRDTLVIKDTLVIINQKEIHHYTDCEDCVKKSRREAQPADQTPAWAVKTNLLMWGVVAPNIEVEIPLGNNNRWSLEAEFFHPWFIWNKNAHASQFLNLGAEIRYWLGKREFHRWLDGWHVGLAAAAGLYDWEWKKHEGYQGEYVNGYVNIGYQHRWGEHWAIDAGIGLGVIASKYRHYYGSSTYPEHHLEEQDYHLMYHDSDHFVFPGATHINVSLVYLFNARPFHFKTRKP